MTECFSMVPLPAERSRKPRRTGITMMMDWGLPMGRAEDYMGLLAPFVDLVKIVVGTARLYPEAYLVKKLDMYKGNNVTPFLGGQFSEYVFATQGWAGMEPFFNEAKRLGFDALEISDNCVPLDDDERARMIKMAIGCGMEVHGEVGSKLEFQSAAELINQAQICLDAGADVVLVEAAELIKDGKPDAAMLGELKAALDLEKTLFELTGPWIKGVTLSGVYELKRVLLDEFGPDVNMANVMPDDVMETEALRCGLSVVGPEVADKAAE
ncbi:MAG: phosphosulfolactate synthase [Proteobacteria bacterium]|nr:phosphosulfolactate synthase [Pseudomonadota bacterium]MDA1024008.1 phosphosulfolactate synthase [Pseudomonadota bacterium]